MHTSLSIGPTEGAGIIDSMLFKSGSVLLEYVCSCKKEKFGAGSLNDPYIIWKVMVWGETTHLILIIPDKVCGTQILLRTGFRQNQRICMHFRKNNDF